MGDFCKIKKVCGFYASDMHLSMMMLPYINKEIKENKKMIMLLENNLKNNINQILYKWKISDEEKEKILDINWEIKNTYKYENIEKILKNNIEENINIFIVGKENYINATNENIKKYYEKNLKKLGNRKIKIINCFEINEFNKNIKEILDTHDMIFNTSGEHEIEEIFNEYKRENRKTI